MDRALKLSVVQKILTFDGLLSREAQAKLVGLKKDQVSDFWRRYPQHNGGGINGLELDIARFFAPSCPYLYTEYSGGFKLCLWVDIDDLKRESLPSDIKRSISQMARYQVWIHEVGREMLREHICEILMNDL